MSSIPYAPGFDNSLALLAEGYAFIGRRCEQLGSDLFRTRLLMQDVICLRGQDAVALLYGDNRIQRQGGIPHSTLRLLQGPGSVQTLEGTAHHHRKAMFMGMMGEAAQAKLVRHYAYGWQQALQSWQQRAEIRLKDEVPAVLLQAAHAWAGIALPPEQIPRRVTELVAMVENAGRFGPGHWRARWLRQRCEYWARKHVRAARQQPAAEVLTPLARIAHHRDEKGALLPEHVAAIELINLLRPLVAVHRYVLFLVLALHQHPYWENAFRQGDETHLDAFVQETRRFYPFFPFVGARVRQPLTWQGYPLARNQWLLLDLYGTDHHPTHWATPQLFLPERFQARPAEVPVAQGGGSFTASHRCAGEPLTVALMKETVRQLTKMRYRLPPQDLSISLRRIPAMPASGVILSGVSQRRAPHQ
ncbi:cytochrome P450 [Alcanivorax quisquiliarum]|uniref:Cytochrome P450 n=1 Tax=Alcanivorax quisquiliarum TaxID=2933565 RepID=A0ABT0E9I3_9GAMM|nr:cytochrome P450 [Alcanivorax quisquiliarum]MCK0538412.1 cytochrome P450 [Alcanivorax quisquiliarum]